jgi:hypothetical protein
VNRLLSLPTVQRGGAAERRSRRAPSLAYLVRSHPRVSPWGRVWRAGCGSGWLRLARWSFRRPGRRRLRLRGGGIGRTQCRGAAHPTATLVRGLHRRRWIECGTRRRWRSVRPSGSATQTRTRSRSTLGKWLHSHPLRRRKSAARWTRRFPAGSWGIRPSGTTARLRQRDRPAGRGRVHRCVPKLR